MKRLLFVALALAIHVHGSAQNLAGPDAVPWNSLTPAQRSAIGQLERDWNRLTPSQQQKWLEVANRLPSRPASEQERTQQRMGEWSRLPPQERAQSRLNFQELRQLSREERQQQWEAYQALPVDQRRALADRAVVAEPSGRRADRLPALQGEKSSIVQPPALQAPRPVGPTVVQRGAGASTELVSRPSAPPLHQQAGMPKVVATPGFVDSATLLPQRGAQGAAAQPARKNDRGANKQQ
jgi:Protein of unknown function (DUF3106)